LKVIFSLGTVNMPSGGVSSQCLWFGEVCSSTFDISTKHRETHYVATLILSTETHTLHGDISTKHRDTRYVATLALST